MIGLSKGWFRLCLFTTGVWLALVFAVAANEYLNQNMFYEFGVEDAVGAVSPARTHIFWEWLPEQLAKTWAFTLAHGNNVADRPHAFVPNFPKLALAVFGIPAAIWVVASGVAWIARGFKERA